MRTQKKFFRYTIEIYIYNLSITTIVVEVDDNKVNNATIAKKNHKHILSQHIKKNLINLNDDCEERVVYKHVMKDENDDIKVDFK